MSLKTEKYLIDAPKRYELVVGVACALVSVATANLLIWLIYLVGWRNPKVYGVHDFFKISTIAFFLILFLISLGFSILAFRLLTPRRNQRPLLSPLLLRLWGAFFAVASLFVLATALMKKEWEKILAALETLPFSVTLALAAFLLARKKDGDDHKL